MLFQLFFYYFIFLFFFESSLPDEFSYIHKLAFGVYICVYAVYVEVYITFYI